MNTNSQLPQGLVESTQGSDNKYQGTRLAFYRHPWPTCPASPPTSPCHSHIVLPAVLLSWFPTSFPKTSIMFFSLTWTPLFPFPKFLSAPRNTASSFMKPSFILSAGNNFSLPWTSTIFHRYPFYGSCHCPFIRIVPKDCTFLKIWIHVWFVFDSFARI